VGPVSVLFGCDDDDHWSDNILRHTGHQLALDLACKFHKPSRELIRLLANIIPPLHLVSLWKCTTFEMYCYRMATITYLVSMFPEDTLRYWEGKLPFHIAY